MTDLSLVNDLAALPRAKKPTGKLKLVKAFGLPRGGATDSMTLTVYRHEPTGEIWVHVAGGVAGANRWHGPVAADHILAKQFQ